MAESMTTQPSLDLIAERVERLLVRHEELQRTNTLLTDQVIALTQERDLLRLRLQAARARVDALIERLPANQGECAHVRPAGADAANRALASER